MYKKLVIIGISLVVIVLMFWVSHIEKVKYNEEEYNFLDWRKPVIYNIKVEINEGKYQEDVQKRISYKKGIVIDNIEELRVQE